MSPEEYAKQEQEDKMILRLHAMPPRRAIQFIHNVERLLEEGSFGLKSIENVDNVKEVVKELKYGHQMK
jgi:hypothetical protein